MPLTLTPSPTSAQYQPTKPRKAPRRNRSEADAVGLFGGRGNCAESKRVRCFIAVPLEAPALAGAQRLLASLREQVPGVRWVHPEALHITVHFFGNIADEQVGSGLQAVMPVADDTPPFPAGLDGLGTFPPRGRTRVLWLGASKEMPMFTALVQGCRAALRGAGFEVDERTFRAHCTLGRPREPWPQEGLDAWRAAAARPVRVAPFKAARLVLYESVSAPGGNVYTERASFPFGASALGQR
jgi:2'-5' RNA ligase